jgi:hypothetical protein
VKLSNLWKTLTRDQRRAWNAWAKNNKVVLDDGTIRRVSGHKAMTMVMRNRFIADEDRYETQIPWATTWRLNAVSLRDVGPWTGSGAPGDMRLRVEETTVVRTDWFVWATGPVPLATQGARLVYRFLREVNVMEGQQAGETTFNFAADYVRVWGSFFGPGPAGTWPTEHYIYFRVHEHCDGQLGPALGFRGLIAEEL